MLARPLPCYDDVVSAAARLPLERATSSPVHTEPYEALLARVGTDPAHGLSEAEVEKRLARDGLNELPRPQGKSALVQLAAQFSNPIVITLLVAAIIAVIDGIHATGPILVRFGDAT